MQGVDATAAAQMPERWLTAPLVGFLLLVAAAVGGGLLVRLLPRDVAAAGRELADGDLDGAERRQVLRGLRERAAATPGATAPWAAWLAGIALAVPDLPTELPPGVPEPGDQPWLHLGDPMLGAALSAGLAERAGDHAGAAAAWRRVAAQARLGRQPVAAEVAAAALRRLGR